MCAKKFLCFLHTGKSQESMGYLFLAFHAFPGFSGIEFCAFQETMESWKAGSRFQAFHRKGKRGIIIPDSPCFSRLFGLVFHAFQEIVESLKARKAGNIYSWLSTLFQAFQVGIPCFPRNGGILESWESFLPFCAFLHIGESQESAEHFFLAFQASPGFWE